MLCNASDYDGVPVVWIVLVSAVLLVHALIMFSDDKLRIKVDWIQLLLIFTLDYKT